MNALYQSYYYASYQCDRDRCFYIDFGHKKIKLTFCQLLSLRQKVQQINLDAHFDQEMNYHGLEILTLCNREHLFVLDTLQIIDFKQLLKATFGMLELHSLVSHT